MTSDREKNDVVMALFIFFIELCFDFLFILYCVKIDFLSALVAMESKNSVSVDKLVNVKKS